MGYYTLEIMRREQVTVRRLFHKDTTRIEHVSEYAGLICNNSLELTPDKILGKAVEVHTQLQAHIRSTMLLGNYPPNTL